jgi:hypothetical protein
LIDEEDLGTIAARAAPNAAHRGFGRRSRARGGVCSRFPRSDILNISLIIARQYA